MAQPRNRERNEWFDRLTLAALVTAAGTVVATFVSLGPEAARDRLGCGVVDIVNRSLDLDQPCHALR